MFPLPTMEWVLAGWLPRRHTAGVGGKIEVARPAPTSRERVFFLSFFWVPPMTTYWVIALLVMCAQPDDTITPCRMISNSYLGGHELFLKKEECLEHAKGSPRWSCVEVHGR